MGNTSVYTIAMQATGITYSLLVQLLYHEARGYQRLLSKIQTKGLRIMMLLLFPCGSLNEYCTPLIVTRFRA
jgi:hypothetical protein